MGAWHFGVIFLTEGKRGAEGLQGCCLGQARLRTTSQSASQTAPLVGEPLAKRRSFPLCQSLPYKGRWHGVSRDGEVVRRESLWQAARRKKTFRRLRLREGQVIWQSGKIATYHRAKTHFAKVAICQSAGILTPVCQKGQNAKLANWQNIT